MSIVLFTHQLMNLNNLKIYCQTEEDQNCIVDFISENSPEAKISTWEPDGEPGSWGMFVDDFPPTLWDNLTDFLEGEDSWVLDESVEMALECDDPVITKYYE